MDENEQDDTGRKLVRDLVDKLECMPCCWDEFVGEDLARRVKEYLGWKKQEDKE